MQDAKLLKFGVVKALKMRGQNPENRVSLERQQFIGGSIWFLELMEADLPPFEQNPNMEVIMEENSKEKFALWLRPETKQMVEKNYKDSGCRSRSDFIEKAILFYCGYRTATDYREYFPNIIVSTMKGMLDTFENRMANLLFKNAVELSMLLHVVSATHSIDGDTLADLKAMCTEEVKRLNGMISLENAWKFQRRIDDRLEK